MSARRLFRLFRIFVLLVILLGVAAGSWLTTWRATSWDKPLWITVYPIAADTDPSTQRYIDRLQADDFASISNFIADEAAEYGLAVSQPFQLRLAPQVDSLPPTPPTQGATWEIMLWSLKLRFWAWQANTYRGPSPDIRIFVKYYSVDDAQQPLAHSLGLQEGMLGVVNAFASHKMTRANAVVITHEILHTLGASDKYDRQTGLPLFPQGYAEADRQPRYPQELAEIMGGKIPLSPQQARIPRGLHEVILGEQTAREIHWLEQD